MKSFNDYIKEQQGPIDHRFTRDIELDGSPASQEVGGPLDPRHDPRSYNRDRNDPNTLEYWKTAQDLVKAEPKMVKQYSDVFGFSSAGKGFSVMEFLSRSPKELLSLYRNQKKHIRDRRRI